VSPKCAPSAGLLGHSSSVCHASREPCGTPEPLLLARAPRARLGRQTQRRKPDFRPSGSGDSASLAVAQHGSTRHRKPAHGWGIWVSPDIASLDVVVAGGVVHHKHGPVGALAQQRSRESSSGRIPSCVASQSEYGVDDCAGRACDHPRDDAEIDSQLRTQHGQDEKETNDD
jgi:hypothetical protein